MGWLLNLLRRRLWSRSRNIFEYFDGHRLRRIDPAAAVRSLETSDDFDWENDPGLIEFGDQKALNRTVEAVRKAFGVEPLNESSTIGLTESETIELLISFTQWLEFQKKSGSGLLILPVGTASASSGSESVTSASSGSGSTSNDSNSETALPST